MYCHIGLFHEQWFVEELAFIALVPMLLLSQPHLPTTEI